MREVLYVTDLVEAFYAFIKKSNSIQNSVYNIGGGVENTLSLLELLDLLEEITGKRSDIRYDKWRPSDQKVYISDLKKAKEELGWKPKVSPREGVKLLVEWVKDNINIF